MDARLARSWLAQQKMAECLVTKPANCGSERDITVRPDIRPLEGHQKIDVCGPGADALDAQQRRMRIFIVQAREAIEMTPGKSLRDLNAVVRFLSRQAK